MFALSLALLTFAILGYQTDAATFIWSACAIGSIGAMIAYWRDRAPNEVPFN